MQEVKNFSSGVLSGGGSIQRAQEREARRAREQQEKEARELEEQRLAEVVEKRNRQREQRALEIAEQARVRQAAEEERHRRENEKDARQEEQGLKAAAEREAARLEKQKDLERRLAEKKEQTLAKQAADEAAALLAKQSAAQKKSQEAMRKTQAAALLDELSKESKAPEAPKTAASQKEALKETQETEGLEEPVLTVVKGEAHVPAVVPTMAPTPEPQSAYDLTELLPAPAVLTSEMQSDQPVEHESAMELMERLTKDPEKKDDSQEAKSPRSENRFQKIINANRELSKENEILKEKIEKLLDEVHNYKIEDELVDKITTTSEHAKKQIAKVPKKITLEDHLQPEPFSIVNEAKKEMLNYLSTRQDEVDHFHKSALFLKYIQDPFYMNMFVQNNQVSQWWPVIDSIYNSIELPTPDWSKVKTSVYQPKTAPQPIRARTATLGAPVVSSDQPMDRIAQHLGNMGI
jgi:hypothetical protein